MYLTEIDKDFLDRHRSGPGVICAPSGWEMNPVCYPIIRSQLRRWKAARYVYVAVMAAEHEVALSEEKVLYEAASRLSPGNRCATAVGMVGWLVYAIVYW